LNLSAFAVRRSITTIMVVLCLVVLGFISLFRLPLEYAPDFTWPSMYVSVSYPSSSPEEIETKITRPLEEAMGTLPGIKAMSSRSYDSRCYVRVEFDYGTDMDVLSIQVRDRIDAVRGLMPDDVERIETRRWSSDDWEILDYRLTWLGEHQEDLMDAYKHTILPRLQRLEGVGSVEIEGVDEKALMVEVDQSQLDAHRLDVRAINRAIRSSNVNVSAGQIRDAGRRLSVRSVGEFSDIDQIRQLPLRQDVELRDVASVTYDYPERRYLERLDGRDAVSIEIRKTSTANLVATADLVKREMEAISEEIGKDRLNVHLTRDQSVTVTDGIKNLAQSAILGGILSISIIFLFLRNFRSTVIIGSAIPISLLCVFTAMFLLRKFAGATITINMVSMMGLMVAIGMLVDPAVVTLENIFRKRFDEGQDVGHAAIEGAREIGMPVVASGLTTICVFVPLVFVGGSRQSMWMQDFATTVCVSVIASLCVALAVIPLAASRAFGERGAVLDRILKFGLGSVLAVTIVYFSYRTGLMPILDWLGQAPTLLFSGASSVPTSAWVFIGIVTSTAGLLYFRFRKTGLRSIYTSIVGTTLRFRWTTVAAACCILGLGFHVYSLVEKRPYRFQSTRRLEYTIEMPKTYGTDDALVLFRQIEEILIPRKAELDIDAVRTRHSTRRGNSITLYLVSADKGKLTTDEIKKKVKDILPKDIPGVRFKAGRRRGGSSSGVGIEIKGYDSQILALLAEDIKRQMEDLEGVHEVETSLEAGTEEIRVTVDRVRARRYGLSPRAVATNIATALGTRGSSKYKTENGEVDITVLLQEDDRATLQQLRNTHLESDSGELVSLGTLASFNLQSAPRSIERQDRMSTVDVFANTEQSEMYTVGLEMKRRMEAVPLPPGYSWQMDRSFRSISAEQSETDFTMILAIFLIYLIMASLFESYIHPFTILLSISFAFTGVALGLYAFKTPMDSNATYGLLILFGIVVNNGIVLIDHINRYRKQGLSRRQAILQGGRDRVRPILMTATTTILGLVPLVAPMVYGTAEGYARAWGPIGLVIISGLLVSTVLTLVLLPTIYSLLDDFAQSSRRAIALAWKSERHTGSASGAWGD
jgi:hydrophobic/amphiphilic exporter-1 (mainly G- bacteria), HAE1 family